MGKHVFANIGEYVGADASLTLTIRLGTIVDKANAVLAKVLHGLDDEICDVHGYKWCADYSRLEQAVCRSLKENVSRWEA
jgi:hypothetical protein